MQGDTGDTLYLPGDIYYSPDDNHYLPDIIHYLPDDIYYLREDIYYLLDDTHYLPADIHYLPEDIHYQPEDTYYLPDHIVPGYVHNNNIQSINQNHNPNNKYNESYVNRIRTRCGSILRKFFHSTEINGRCPEKHKTKTHTVSNPKVKHNTYNGGSHKTKIERKPTLFSPATVTGRNPEGK